MSQANEVPAELIAFDDVIEQLRDKLGGMAAALKKSGHDVAFAVEEVEVELQVAVQRAAEGGAKASLYVVEFSTKGARTDVVTQKVKLKLKPFDRKSKGKLDINSEMVEPE
jgi:hypothetical protein